MNRTEVKKRVTSDHTDQRFTQCAETRSHRREANNKVYEKNQTDLLNPPVLDSKI